MLNMTRQRAKPTSRKKLLIPRINKEVALSEKGRKRKSWGDDSDKEYEVESLDNTSNKEEVSNYVEEVTKEDYEQYKLEEEAIDQNDQNKLEEEDND